MEPGRRITDTAESKRTAGAPLTCCVMISAMPAAYIPIFIFLAIAIADSTTVCVGVVMFQRGRWKQRKV